MGVVYLLAQLHPNFEEIVGDLANVVEVVLFPVAVAALLRSNGQK